jgi:predicted transcriptional regulator
MLFEVEVVEKSVRKGTVTVEADSKIEAEMRALREVDLGGLKLIDVENERSAVAAFVGGG